MPEPGTWRRLGPSRVTAEVALSQGLQLLAAAAPGDPVTLAWWAVDRDTLVLGRGTRVEADLDACRAAGVPVVRRSSGGGPVLWGPDLLALDVVVPRGHRLYSDDVVESYRWLGEALAQALREVGVDARALPPVEARARNDGGAADLACFAGRSAWEVVDGDAKLAGLSQVRRQAGVLLQAGIPRRFSGADLGSLLRIDPSRRAWLSELAWTLPGTAVASLRDAVERAATASIEREA